MTSHISQASQAALLLALARSLGFKAEQLTEYNGIRVFLPWMDADTGETGEDEALVFSFQDFHDIRTAWCSKEGV